MPNRAAEDTRMTRQLDLEQCRRDRAARYVARLEQGTPLKVLAAEDGISPQTVNAFLRSMNLPSSMVGAIQAKARREAQQLTDEQIADIALASVYEGDESIPYRAFWVRDIGIPFARAILAAARANP
jgi:hypothetical protein